MDLSIQNVINISVSENPAGLTSYNTSNLAYFTREPYADGYMSNGYESVIDSSAVPAMFGSNSLADKVARAVFSQQKNIRSGDGRLIIIPLLAPTQIISLDNVPDTGTIDLSYDGSPAVTFSVGDLTDADAMTAKLRTIDGLGNVKATISTNGLQITVDFIGFEVVPALIATANNTLEASSTPVTVGVAQDRGLETLLEAMQRTESTVPYFGIIHQKLASDATLPDEASYIQTLRKMYFPVQTDKAYLAEDGAFDLVRQAGQNRTRGLVYTISEETAILMSASYASRLLSTNFEGSATTQTMHLKDLVGVLPDTGITQSDLDTCKVTGVDLYVSIRGIPKVFTSGGNTYVDRVYNLLWFIGELEISGFNTLATTSTKIPQTEEGVDTLVSSYRDVCKQAITNGFLASGTWTGPDTFGDPEVFKSNIQEFGYYIFTLPLSQQSVTNRKARKAPLAQIAIKESGAIHSSDIIINVNA